MAFNSELTRASASAAALLQAFKKHLGANYLSARCRYVWVSDTESVPIKRFSWARLQKQILASPPGFLHSSWYDDAEGCDYTTNTGRVADCTHDASVRGQWNLTLAWPASGHGPPTAVPWEIKKSLQSVWDVGNWWLYDTDALKPEILSDRFFPNTLSSAITDDFAGRLTDHLTASAVASRGTEGINPRPVRTRPPVAKNFVRLLRSRFPDAFARCCDCTERRRAGGGNPLPCYLLESVWSPCFLEALGGNVTAIAGFITHDLGMPGIFGNILASVENRVPIELLQDPRVTWCFNNCLSNEVSRHVHGKGIRFGFSAWEEISGIDLSTVKVHL